MAVHRLMLRADGSSSLGMGHVMRTLALAECARERGFDVQYLVNDDPIVASVLGERGMPSQVVDRAWVETLRDSDLVAVDADVSDSELARAREIVSGLALIDDAPTRDRPVDLTVAPDLTAVPTQISGRVLIGWEHALIRREFRREARNAPSHDLLAIFGGTDPTGLGADFVQWFANRAPDIDAVLVLGPGADPVSKPPPVGLTVVRDPDNFAAMLASAAAVITSGGTTMLECAAMGLPMAVIAAVPNQRLAVSRMAEAGAIELDPTSSTEDGSWNAVLETLMDQENRHRIGAAVSDVVDGRGADRIFEALGRISDDREVVDIQPLHAD